MNTNKKHWRNEKGEVIAVPNHSYIKLQLVRFNAAMGRNETVVMQADESGETFRLIKGETGRKYGRKAPKMSMTPLLMEDWDNFFWRKIETGWRVKAVEPEEEIEVKKTAGNKPIKDKEVADIINIFTTASNRVFEEEYSIKIENIPKEDLDAAQKLLNELSAGKTTLTPMEFNNKLLDLWFLIPRVIRNLNKEKVNSPEEYQEKLEKEQELLDLVKSMLRDEITGNSQHLTILEENNLEVVPVTAEEQDKLIDMMGNKGSQFNRAFRVINHKTEKAFNDFIAAEGLKEDQITELFHGSRTENWWSILANGLYLNPEGVRINGKMFGWGLYFAPKAQKSMGYTSARNSCWAHGSESTGYLAVFKVATGNIYEFYDEPNRYTPNHYEDFHRNAPDKHCLWARGRETCSNSSLLNDEVIIYKEEQATIEYIIEYTC